MRVCQFTTLLGVPIRVDARTGHSSYRPAGGSGTGEARECTESSPRVGKDVVAVLGCNANNKGIRVLEPRSRSLTWDQGSELARRVESGSPIYFCSGPCRNLQTVEVHG